ncbi:procollagen-proline 4-dioxygenase [Fragilaria crotonensis]|nr:procollagen-proline 4-dioxygenase [Fragilaria crotonensis]
MSVSCDVHVAQGPLDHAVESSAISTPTNSELGLSLAVAQGSVSIDHVPTTNKEETESNDSTSKPTPMTMMARTVPQRRCNTRISTRHLSRLDQLFWKTDRRNTPVDAVSVGPTTRKRKLETTNPPVITMTHGRLLLKRVHDSPHIYIIDNFLTETELNHCHSIIQQAKFQKSFVDASETTQSTTSASTFKTTTTRTTAARIDTDHRTSTFVSVAKQADRIIAAMERKSADLLGMNVDRLEPLQLVRYQKDQFFGVHHDLGTLIPAEDDNDDDENGYGTVELPPKSTHVKRRLVTLFCYLNTVDEGGCTYFPALDAPRTRRDAAAATSAIQELRVAPVRGRAVLFCNILKDGDADPRTVHAGEPVRGIKGTVKYGLNIWACEE